MAGDPKNHSFSVRSPKLLGGSENPRRFVQAIGLSHADWGGDHARLEKWAIAEENGVQVESDSCQEMFLLAR